MHISQDRWLALNDPSKASFEAAPPIPQSASGIVTASRSDLDFVADSRLAAGAAKPSGAGYPLVAIAGPTASGKSALSLHVAKVLNGEIINCDSVQVYRGLDIGSGKVSLWERFQIPHHLLDVLNPGQVITAGHYRRLALEALGGIRDRGRLPILVGGTGLYLRALLQGLFEGPARSDPLRGRLREMAAHHRREFVHRLLRRLDPEAARRIHPHDGQKLIRAIEVCVLSGERISTLHSQGRDALSGFRIIKIGLRPDRLQLSARIDRRVESMFASGLVQEARALLARDDTWDETRSGPLGALGYRQACRVVRGESSLLEAVRDTQAATRRYAKRQLTWFRREPNVTWLDGFGDEPALQNRAVRWLQSAIAPGEMRQKDPALRS